MAEAGKTVAQVREEIQREQQVEIGTLRRNGAAPAPDPVRDALATRREVLASKIVEQTVAEAETQTLEQENKRLAAEIERQKLAAVARGGDTSGWQEYLMGELKELRGAVSDRDKQLSEMQAAILQDRMGMLTSELERIRQTQAQPTGSGAPLMDAIQQVQAAKEAFETLSPKQAESPLAAVNPSPDVIGLQAFQLIRQMEHEDRKLEREERRAERDLERQTRREELQLQREVELEKLRAEREIAEKRSARMDKAITETMPHAMGILNMLAQRFLAPSAGAVPGAVAAVAAPVAAADARPPTQLLPGVESMRCQNPACGATILFRPQWGGVFCPGCGAEYSQGPGPSREAAPSRSIPEYRTEPEEEGSRM